MIGTPLSPSEYSIDDDIDDEEDETKKRPAPRLNKPDYRVETYETRSIRL